MRKGVKWDILIRQASNIGNDLKYAPMGRVPFQIFTGINSVLV